MKLWNLWKTICLKWKWTQCLKITQNIAFLFSNWSMFCPFVTIQSKNIVAFATLLIKRKHVTILITKWLCLKCVHFHSNWYQLWGYWYYNRYDNVDRSEHTGSVIFVARTRLRHFVSGENTILVIMMRALWHYLSAWHYDKMTT